MQLIFKFNFLEKVHIKTCIRKKFSILISDKKSIVNKKHWFNNLKTLETFYFMTYKLSRLFLHLDQKLNIYIYIYIYIYLCI